MDDVRVTRSALVDLRDSLTSIWEAQSSGIDSVLLDVTRARLEVEAELQDAIAKYDSARSALASCEALAAVADGEANCAPLAEAQSRAYAWMQHVHRTSAELDAAAYAFETRVEHHRAYLDASIDRIRGSLNARIASVEAYLAYQAGRTTTSAGTGHEGQPGPNPAKPPAGSERPNRFRIPNPVEALERYGPERE